MDQERGTDVNVLVGVCARQHPAIFDAFLESLFGLDAHGIELRYLFIFHNWDEGRALLESRQPAAAEVEMTSYRSRHPYLADEVSHRWSRGLVEDLTHMRNMVLRRALETESEAVFMVDSDLLLHPRTLRRLCESGREVIAEIFWTRWQPGAPELPNAWEHDEYGIGQETLRRWRRPGQYQVGGAGACTLIRSSAIRKGLSYTPVPSVSWVGEDRALQLRAAVLGIPIYLDTHHPAFHVYRLGYLAAGRSWYASVRPQGEKPAAKTPQDSPGPSGPHDPPTG